MVEAVESVACESLVEGDMPQFRESVNTASSTVGMKRWLSIKLPVPTDSKD